jgi:tetratricopeptide (TPR) repeat protein
LAAAYPRDRHFQSGLAVAYAKIGDVQAGRGDSTRALAGYRRALATYETLSGDEPNNAQYRGNLAAILGRLGHTRAVSGNRAGALKDFRRSLDVHKALAAADPSDAKAQEGLWNAYFDFAGWLEPTDRRGAVENYRLAVAVIEARSVAQPMNLQVRDKLAATLIALGDLLEKGGDRRGGHPLIDRSVALRKSLADRPDASPGELNSYATTVLSCLPGHPCDGALALPYAKRAVELSKEGDPASLETLAVTYFKLGEPARAVATETKAVALVPSPGARASYEATLLRFQKALKHHHD